MKKNIKTKSEEIYFEGIEEAKKGDLIQFSPFLTVVHTGIVIDLISNEKSGPLLEKQMIVYSLTDGSEWTVYLYLDTVNILSKIKREN